MKAILISLLLTSFLVAPISSAEEEGWIPLFNGENLEGWKSNDETSDVFSVTEQGELKVDGGRAHLFYVGEAGEASYEDFVLKAKVKTTPGSNSGLYFHTKFQENGWPKDGFECQVNTTHGDARKTGSLYGVKDVRNDAPSTDGEWFDYEIRVEGKAVTITVNGETMVEWTQPDDWTPPGNMPGREIGSGTFAIQGHDPKSVTYFKDIKVKPL